MRRFVFECILHAFILLYALAIMIFVCIPMKNYVSDDASDGKGHGIFNFFAAIIKNIVTSQQDEDGKIAPSN